MRRLTGRRICKAGGHIYNVYERPPKREGICDVDGSELIHRPDDSEGVIGERLAAYDRQTQPLVEYYTVRGLLKSHRCDGRRGHGYRKPSPGFWTERKRMK